MKGTKKVVILDKVNSPLISHAIFILRDTDKSEFSALLEAERIVNEYMAGKKCSKNKKSRLFIGLSAFGSVIALLLYLHFRF